MTINGAVSTGEFVSLTADCGADGSFFCNAIPAGGSATYQFSWSNAIAAGDFTVGFDVQCSDGSNLCVGDLSTIVTSVIPESISVASISLTGLPGETVTSSFTVVDAFATDLTTDPNVDGSVSPATLPAGGGTVDYSLTVPLTAVSGSVISDTITITDAAQGGVVATIPVTLTVSQTSLSASVADITQNVTPGQIVPATFTVTSTLGTDITTNLAISSVTPVTLPAGGGAVDYSITVPADAIAGDLIEDVITITDVQGTSIAIPVTLSVQATIVSTSVSEISITGLPGATVPTSFTVVSTLSTEITTSSDVDSSVNPTTLPAGGGNVTYSLTVPPTAAFGDEIQDTITITDSTNNTTTIAVALRVGEGVFSSLPGLTDSERSVAIALDNACDALNIGEISLTDGQSNLRDICNLLLESPQSVQIDAIKEITPKQAPAQGSSSVEVSQRQFDNITARMAALRSGATGFNVSDLSINFQGAPIPLKLLSSAYAASSGGSAGEENTALFGKFGFFINGNLSIGDKNPTSNELGFEVDTQGITAGVDYRFTDQFIVGGSVGYVGSDADFDGSRGALEVEGYTLALYSTYYHGTSTYLDAIVSYGWNDFDSTRSIGFTGFSGDASGNTDGTEYSISLGGGYDFNHNGFSFGPFARINYVNADIDGYTETSSTGLELVYEDQEVQSLTSMLGAQLSYAISTSKGVFSPQLRMEWAHEFDNDSRFIQARFLNDPTSTSFELSTDNPDRDYFNLGAGVSATFASGKSGYLYYESVLGQKNIRQDRISAGLRIEF